MLDIQKLMDSMGAMDRNTRSGYHVTLGALTSALEALPPETPVEFDDGAPVGAEGSYRGYYSDLAFSLGGKPSTAADVLAACRRAATNTYEGYKGGDYKYDDRTPLWRAQYGYCGPAIIAADARDGKLVLVTKNVE